MPPTLTEGEMMPENTPPSGHAPTHTRFWWWFVTGFIIGLGIVALIVLR